MLAAGADGKTRIQVSAQTSALGALPFDLPVRVQLRTRAGACWEASFDGSRIKRNDTERFDASSAD
jgi:hypothetical protein